MNPSTCPTCKNQRWLFYVFTWDRKTGKLLATWKPFDRARWSAGGDQDLSLLLVTKALKTCATCNPDAVAPWDERFRAAAPGAEAPETPNGAPL